MTIDRDFRAKRKKVWECEGIVVWDPFKPPKKLWLRGANMTVDWDICEGERPASIYAL